MPHSPSLYRNLMTILCMEPQLSNFQYQVRGIDTLRYQYGVPKTALFVHFASLARHPCAPRTCPDQYRQNTRGDGSYAWRHVKQTRLPFPRNDFFYIGTRRRWRRVPSITSFVGAPRPRSVHGTSDWSQRVGTMRDSRRWGANWACGERRRRVKFVRFGAV